MVVNKILIFKKIPDELPVSGVHFAVENRPFDLDTVPGGGTIVEVLSVSLDPYLRTRMRDTNVPMFSDHYIIAVDLDWVRCNLTDEDSGPAYFQQHQETLQKRIAEGSFKVKLHITHGIDNAPEGFGEMYQGKNFGKAPVKIKELTLP
ncbi:putative nadp-dependent leukotriene b4 12-hydroxydehydrogenase protein [Daldinia childiae]|uniref:putative nadp-dependent leukotriene b4 12-hydroxydehydrogenase protein n=1 Tax=Daldinia childiae TaxID=326645 RepID=UPI0014484C40|nr:putative nadp-dependent leukotriene b4 12-hydroxydehydrogenase protein [Daldinia childiae]KAF3061587.1 putative nadp-dependent leukotriene b4 12-hydroxydehydrogenase protein [Daldinia childiae]